MSSTANGENTLEVTAEDGLLLQGVLAVAEELLVREDVPFGLPLARDQRDDLMAVSGRLERRLAGPQGRGDIIREVLDPGEAQAVFDALVSVEALMSSEDGRDILSNVGLIADPSSPTVRQEREELGEMIEQLDPEERRGRNGALEPDLGGDTGRLGPPERDRQIDRGAILGQRGTDIESMADIFEEALRLVRVVRDDPQKQWFVEDKLEELEDSVRGEPTCERLAEVFGGLSILLSGLHANNIPPRERNPLLSDARTVGFVGLEAAVDRDCISESAEPNLRGTWGHAVDGVAEAMEGDMIGRLEAALEDTREAFVGTEQDQPVPSAAAGETGEILDPTLPLVDALAATDADIRNGAIAYPGVEQARFVADDIADGIHNMDRSCEDFVHDTLELLLLVVGAGRRGEISMDRDEEFSLDGVFVDLLAGDIFGLMQDRGCITEREEEQLRRAFGNVQERAVEEGRGLTEPALDFTTLLDEAQQPG